MVLEQFIIDADIIWDQVGKTFFENPEAKPGRIMRVQVVNAGIVEDLTGYTLNLGWTSVRDPSKFGLDAFDDVDITKGIFEIEYTSGMLTNVGPLNASLQLVPPGEGRPIESNNFKLTVKNSAINAEAIQGENSFSTLETALVKVNDWNARIDDVEQDFKDRADALDEAYPVRLTAAEQSVAAVEAQVDLLNRGLGETMPTMASLLATYPTGDTRDHIVAGNIAEVDTLTVTGVPTTAGNVTVTLNGVAVNVPVTVGVAEVASLLVTAVPTVAGNVTINLNGVPITVALDPAVQTTTDLVAAAIRAVTFTGWIAGGTGSTVTFTATAVGTKTDATYSAGTTGATGTMTTTTQGVAAATTTTVATAIRAAVFAGWTTGGTGAVVTFTATTAGTRTAPVFSAGTTGTTGTFVRTAIGEAPNFHRYFWNDAAWTDGGAYQAVELVDGSVTGAKLANDSVTADKIAGLEVTTHQINNAVTSIGRPTLISIDDFVPTPAGYGKVTSIDVLGKLYANSGNYVFGNAQLDPSINHISFRNEKSDGFYLVLGGTLDNFTVLCLQTDNFGKIFDVSKTAASATKYPVAAMAALTSLGVGAIVSVEVTPTGYIVSITKSGSTTVNTFIIDKVNYPLSVNWINSYLGIMGFNGYQTTALLSEFKLLGSASLLNNMDNLEASIEAVKLDVGSINKAITIEHLVKEGELISGNGITYTLAENVSGKTELRITCPNPTGGPTDWSSLFLSDAASNDGFTFTYANNVYLLLGYTSSTAWSGIGLQPDTMGKLIEFTSTGHSIKYQSELAYGTVISVGTRIHVSYDADAFTYSFKKKAIGDTEFVDWFTIVKTDYPIMVNWGTTTRFGFLGYEGYAASYLVAKDLTVGTVGSAASQIAAKLTELSEALAALKSASANNTTRFFGKIANFLGDSITAGVGASSVATRYTTLVKEALGLSAINNYGISGTLITHEDGRTNAFVDRYSSMAAADIIIVYGITNDYWNGTGVLGPEDSVNIYEVYGALNVLMSGLIAKYPNGEIIFITPNGQYFNGHSSDVPNPNSGLNMKGYRDAILNRCEHYGITTLDLFSIGGMDIAHDPTARTTYTTDGVHSNDAGNKRIADRLVGLLKML